MNRRGANYYVWNPYGGLNAIVNLEGEPITRGGGETATTPIAGFTYGSNASFASQGRILHLLNVPANRFDTAIAGSSPVAVGMGSPCGSYRGWPSCAASPSTSAALS